MDRRGFLKLAGIGGLLLASGLGGSSLTRAADSGHDRFMFAQLSDTHVGFDEKDINPDYEGTLIKAGATVNGLATQPDFVVFTGDLTHTVDDPKERRKRLGEFRNIAKGLKVKDVKFLPGSTTQPSIQEKRTENSSDHRTIPSITRGSTLLGSTMYQIREG